MINYIVTIAPLVESDYFATINNFSYKDDGKFQGKDVGQYLDIMSIKLSHSILDLSIESSIVIDINSTYDIDENRPDIEEFISTLEGRRISVHQMVSNSKEDKIIYDGFIAIQPESISVHAGTQINLICQTVLSQLNTISSNRNWDESTRKYGNVFLTLSDNKISKELLFSSFFDGTLLQDVNTGERKVIFIDGDLPKLPNSLWAQIIPDKMRLEVLREILIPYGRIIYQRPNGDIVVSGLFINDYCAEVFNINVRYNFYNSYLNIEGSKNSCKTPNRIDVMFGVDGFAAFSGNEDIDTPDSNVFCSAPYIKDGKIVDSPQSKSNGSQIKYTEVYKSSTRLYNSGFWQMPKQKTTSIADVMNDTIMLNMLDSKLYEYSNVFSTAHKEKFNFAKLYAQLYLAELNATNYNSTVTYDYGGIDYSVWKLSEANPLAKIVTIENYGLLDYPQNLVVTTTLTADIGTGSILSISTAPLLSITPFWGKI